jgi:hypothetical protein
MIFQTKWDNAAYIVRPTIKSIHPGFGTEIKPGLRAEFTGPQRLFDSNKNQQRYQWSDEERERVEKHLLKHRDFGQGLYLAPGQDLPADMEKHLTTKGRAASHKRCLSVVAQDGEIIQCEDEAMVGQDFCSAHRTDRVNISKGMTSTVQ